MSSPSADHGSPVVVVGAGLAGLTAGRELAAAGVDYLIVEARDRPGGLCRSEVTKGFTFDYTGHLLHLREGPSKDLILGLIGQELAEHERRASVYVKGSFVDYPIQANFGMLPAPYADRCLKELLASAGDAVSGDMAFDLWAEKRFGPTLANLFMVPYNAKLYLHPLREMEISWTSWSVPVPTEGELRSISRGEPAPAYGYNTSFYYPRRGGIELLPRALSAGQEKRIRTGLRVVRVDADARTVTLANGDRLSYSTLINTMPLPDLLAVMKDPGGSMARKAGRLRYSSVLGVCLGLDRPVETRDHWIYFPGEDIPFYRMGFPSNFSDHVAPAGCGSVYAELAFSKGAAPDPGPLAGEVLQTLGNIGLADRSTGVKARLDLAIPYAYVFHDLYRAQNLEPILTALAAEGILSVGRYGAWEYSAMQDAVQWGLSAAREILA